MDILMLLVPGAIIGAVLMIFGAFRSLKKGNGKTEIKIFKFGTISTSHIGPAIIFIGLFLYLTTTSIMIINKDSIIKEKDEIIKAKEKKIEGLTGKIGTCNSLIASLGSIISEEEQASLKLKIANELKISWKAINDIEENRLKKNMFSLLDGVASSFYAFDSKNGHALYYKGELARILTSKEESHKYFYAYLEHEKILFNQKKDMKKERYRDDAEICYELPDGYCRQRTGWICHLMANDFYERSIRAKDVIQKKNDLEKAFNFVLKSICNFPSTFVQESPYTTKWLYENIPLQLKNLGCTDDMLEKLEKEYDCFWFAK